MNITFEFATQDDCLEKMVPSDLRRIVCERDTLKQQNAELAAQVDAYRATLEYFVSDEFEWNDPHDSMIGDIHKLLELPPAQCLLEVKAEAGRAGFMYCAEKYGNMLYSTDELVAASNQYANKVRGGE